MPAAFSDSSAMLSLALASGEQLSILSTGNTHSLSLGATGTWSGTNAHNVTGNGKITPRRKTAMFLRPFCPFLGWLIGKTRRDLYSARHSRRSAFGYAFERLEYRITLTANISVTDVSLLDASFNPAPTVSPGQRVFVEVDFQTVDLPADASYNISFTVNGFTLSTGPLTIGAGVAGATNHGYDWGQFVITPGSNQISANVDPGQSVAETSYSDNTATATVNAVPSAIGPLSYSVSQIRTAYGINSLQDFGSAFADGSGQTIAIVDEYNDPNIFSDLDGFDNSMNISSGNDVTLSQLYGTASSFLSVYNQSGVDITSQIANSGVGSVPLVDPRFATNPGSSWEGEETLDVEWAHAIAPGAHIDLIETTGSGPFGGLYVGAAAAAAIPGVSVVSMSWSWNENNWSGLAGEQALDSSTFTTPSGHTGVTFLAMPATLESRTVIRLSHRTSSAWVERNSPPMGMPTVAKLPGALAILAN